VTGFEEALSRVPQAAPVQPVPLSVQVTALFVELFTVAVNIWVWLTGTDEVAGPTATVIAEVGVGWE
jgi:hypothetical protein